MAMGSGLILVVDDQPLILKLVRAILEGIGVEVISVEQPFQAVQVADEHRDRIRLLITDVHLSGMDGEELARQVLKRCCGLRVLYMSGDDPDDLRLAPKPGHEFIRKPFSPDVLTQRVVALMTE